LGGGGARRIGRRIEGRFPLAWRGEPTKSSPCERGIGVPEGICSGSLPGGVEASEGPLGGCGSRFGRLVKSMISAGMGIGAHVVLAPVYRLYGYSASGKPRAAGEKHRPGFWEGRRSIMLEGTVPIVAYALPRIA